MSRWSARLISPAVTADSCSRSRSVARSWKPAIELGRACSTASRDRVMRTSTNGERGSAASRLCRQRVTTGGRRARTSAAVLRCHEEKRLPGAIIASLSIPWGADKGDADLGGYHLVWPRDLVEAAGGLLAAGARTDALRVLEFLRVTQDADGSWPQNMWVDGEPYWHGIQLDETALPILLVDLLQRDGVPVDVVCDFWPMVRRAASYIVAQGPVTQQDRWEEEPGFAPFTVAVEIAALLVAADLADVCGEAAAGEYLRETADAWNDSIEECLYVRGTALARQLGIDGLLREDCTARNGGRRFTAERLCAHQKPPLAAR